MVLVARPNHRSIEGRHTHHERRYSPSLRSSICCTQKIERRVRRWTTVVGCRCAITTRRREENRNWRALLCASETEICSPICSIEEARYRLRDGGGPGLMGGWDPAEPRPGPLMTLLLALNLPAPSGVSSHWANPIRYRGPSPIWPRKRHWSPT